METDRPSRSPAPAAVEKGRKALIYADDAVHIVVAAFLVAAAVIMLGYAARNFADMSVASIRPGRPEIKEEPVVNNAGPSGRPCHLQIPFIIR